MKFEHIGHHLILLAVQAVVGSIVWAFLRLKKPRSREMNARGYALYNVCLQLCNFPWYRCADANFQIMIPSKLWIILPNTTADNCPSLSLSNNVWIVDVTSCSLGCYLWGFRRMYAEKMQLFSVGKENSCMFIIWWTCQDMHAKFCFAIDMKFIQC